MKNDSQCPLAGEQSRCPVQLTLQELLEEVKSLHQTLKRERKMSREKTKNLTLLSVEDGIKMLTLGDPGKAWTSVELAKELGCSDAAVRKTAYWRTYQKTRKGKRPHSIRNGCINNGSLDGVYKEDFEAIDEAIDKTMK